MKTLITLTILGTLSVAQTVSAYETSNGPLYDCHKLRDDVTKDKNIVMSQKIKHELVIWEAACHAYNVAQAHKTRKLNEGFEPDENVFDVTRHIASKEVTFALAFAAHIDGYPHQETFDRVCSEPEYLDSCIAYLNHFDALPHKKTAAKTGSTKLRQHL